jgi:hypothetical protein
MTITAGFCTRDGLLFCADSLYMGGSKAHQQKLFGWRVDQNTPHACSIVFGLAGHEDNSKMAIEDCLEAFAKCPPAERTGKNVRDIFRNVIGEIHQRYVSARPKDEQDNASFYLIIGAWLPLAGGCRMFKSSGPAVTSAEPYHCTGSGYYLGDFFMKQLANRNMTLRHATLLAIQGISAAKGHDAYCGGPTQFMTISNTGQLSNAVPYNTHDTELYVNRFEGEARTLLFDLANTTSTDEEFQHSLDHFLGHVWRIRHYWKTGVNPQYQHLVDLINSTGLKQSEPPSPQAPIPDLPPQPLPLESSSGSDES